MSIFDQLDGMTAAFVFAAVAFGCKCVSHTLVSLWHLRKDVRAYRRSNMPGTF